MQLDYVGAAAVAGYMTACAVVDYRQHRIPNWLTVPAAVAGLTWSTFAPGGVGLVAALAGFAVGFGLLLLPWLLGGGGMGDVKMLAALGTWLGPVGILVAFGLGAVLAALGMMGVLTYSVLAEGFGLTRRRYLAVASAGGSAVPQAGPRRKRVLPFAVPMAIGTWLYLAWTLWIVSA
jgi:prepilin peptidase CpaA